MPTSTPVEKRTYGYAAAAGLPTGPPVEPLQPTTTKPLQPPGPTPPLYSAMGARPRTRGPDAPPTQAAGADRRHQPWVGAAGNAWGAPMMDNDSLAGSNHRQHVGDRSRFSKTLVEASKVIRIKVVFSNNVIDYLDTLMDLENEVEGIYGDEPELLKCRIALNAMTDRARRDGKNVFARFELANVFDLGELIKQTFKLGFPASGTTLQYNFDSLTQTYPDKLTIGEYARKYRTLLRLLDLDVNRYTKRFINGLSNSQVRLGLRYQELDGRSFDSIVSHAIQLECNIADEKASNVRLVAEPGREEREGEDSLYKIMGIPVTRYVEEARRKSIGTRCWNCFSSQHRAQDCRQRSCRFCDKLVKDINHYSLLCKRAPRSFDQFLKAREIQKQKTEAARFTDNFDGYDFDEDELSD